VRNIGIASLKKLEASLAALLEKSVFFESKGCSIEGAYLIMYVGGKILEKITDHIG
jgi:hypothetical protein